MTISAPFSLIQDRASHRACYATLRQDATSRSGAGLGRCQFLIKNDRLDHSVHSPLAAATVWRRGHREDPGQQGSLVAAGSYANPPPWKSRLVQPIRPNQFHLHRGFLGSVFHLEVPSPLVPADSLPVMYPMWRSRNLIPSLVQLLLQLSSGVRQAPIPTRR